MAHRVGIDGAIHLPKGLIEHLGLGPGDEVSIERVGDALLMRDARRGSRLFRRLAGTEADLLADLRIEREHEARP